MGFHCADCKEPVSEDKQEHSLKVEFSNPGVVFLKSKVMHCSNCESKFSDEHDAVEIFDKIEEEYNKKHHGS